FRRLARFLPRSLKRGKREYFRIQSIRIRVTHCVADVIIFAGLERFDHAVNDLRIDQRTISGQANDGLGMKRLRGVVEAIENIVLVAAITMQSFALAKLGDWVVRRIDG